MTAAVELIALSTPIIASNAVFASRRASRGIDALDSNPVEAIGNIDIAAGQTLKGVRTAEALAASNGLSAAETIRTASNTAVKTNNIWNKIFGGLKTAVDFTSDNINKIIYMTGLIKVLGSKNKKDSLVEEGTAITTMRLFEEATNRLIGMPYITKVNGKRLSQSREALLCKNPFIAKQAAAFNDYCATKELFNKVSLKGIPGILKGLTFVIASILGYKLGAVIAHKALYYGHEEKSAV